MTHSDDVGVVFPPAVAPVQVVIVQIGVTADVVEYCVSLKRALQAAGVRAVVDDRGSERAGKRYFEWERKVSVRGTPCM